MLRGAFLAVLLVFCVLVGCSRIIVDRSDRERKG
jgi:hypothetical protein